MMHLALAILCGLAVAAVSCPLAAAAKSELSVRREANFTGFQTFSLPAVGFFLKSQLIYLHHDVAHVSTEKGETSQQQLTWLIGEITHNAEREELAGRGGPPQAEVPVAAAEQEL